MEGGGKGFLRIRVALKWSKPLLDGFWVPRKERGNVWASMRYEKLSDFLVITKCFIFVIGYWFLLVLCCFMLVLRLVDHCLFCLFFVEVGYIINYSELVIF